MCILIHVNDKWDHDKWNHDTNVVLYLAFLNLIFFQIFYCKAVYTDIKHSYRTSIIWLYYSLLNYGHFRVFLVLHYQKNFYIEHPCSCVLASFGKCKADSS